MKALLQGAPQIRIRPRDHDDISPAWRQPPLDADGGGRLLADHPVDGG